MARKFFAVSQTIIFAITLSINSATSSEAANTWLSAESKYWPDCSAGGRVIDCVESVEFSDPKSEKRDATTGALDYSSITWVKTTFEKNPDWKYNQEFSPMTASKDSCKSHTNEDYMADGCYRAAGLKSNGEDVLFHLMTYTGTESMKVMQWVDYGEPNPAIREDGWKAITVPVGSTWKVTLKSDSLAKNLGWIQANIKNPQINVSTGSDGVGRVSVSGSAYPAYGGCTVAGEKKPASIPDEIWCAKPDTYAETMSQGFSIDLAPYKYTTAAMAGSAPGGVMVSTNGQQSELRYDQEQGILWVPTFAPHFEFDKKTINKGWMESNIKGDVVRKAFKLNPATASNFAKVEVITADGNADVATYSIKYNSATDSVEIRAYNFHYSSPQIKIVLGKPEVQKVASPSKQTKESVITCVKGKSVKRVSGVNPKCPSGWKKK